MEYTEDKILNIFSQYNELLEMASEKAQEYEHLRREIFKYSKNRTPQVWADRIDKFGISYCWYEYGGEEHEYAPIYIIYDPLWKDRATKEILDEIQKAKDAKLKKEKEDRLKSEEMERMTYERLKAKYEK